MNIQIKLEINRIEINARHMIRPHIILFLVITVWIIGCSNAPKDIQETRFMMGTLISFTLVHSDTAQAENAIHAAVDEMQRIEDAFTIYGSKTNDIKTFNESPTNTPFSFTPEVDAILQISTLISQQSYGAFNPTLATLNKLWGFSNTEAPRLPPSSKAIQKHLQGTSHCLQHESKQWIRTSLNCQLDFGAIAKGYAIDRGIEILKKYGIKNAMINAGGDMRIIGKHGQKSWRIGIRHPRHKDKILGILRLQGDVSIVTSGDYERYFIIKKHRYHHILDPKTGSPTHASQSATVIASNATLADAWSTALFVNGGKKSIQLAEKYQLQALIIDSDGQLHMTKNMPINLLTEE